MDQSTYGGVPPYAPIGGYATSSYGRYDESNTAHVSRQGDGVSGIVPYGTEVHGVAAESILPYDTPVSDPVVYGPGAMMPTGYTPAGAGGGMAAQPTLFPASPGDGRPGGHPEEVRLTPVTRRVSRAKKGVPVHTCDICNPPKVFTRAEHLR